jgi:ribose transport system permease protein
MKKSYVNTLKAFILPVVVYLVFLIPNFERFGTLTCLYTIFLQSLLPAAMGLGLALGFISGIFDFTMGSRIILSAVCGGIASTYFGIPGLVLGCLISGVVFGLVAGVVNWLAKIPSLVLTLGLSLIFEITAAYIAKAGEFSRLTRDNIALGRPVPLMITFLIAAALFYTVYYHSKPSFHIRAVGHDEIRAKTMGINVPKMKILTFTIGGFFLGIASIMQISSSGNISLQVNLASAMMLFKPMMGVVIGLALAPLCNIVLGILIGTFSVTTIFVGLLALGLPDTFQNVVLGAFVLIVMFISSNPDLFKNILKRKANVIG